MYTRIKTPLYDMHNKQYVAHSVSTNSTVSLIAWCACTKLQYTETLICFLTFTILVVPSSAKESKLSLN